MGFMPIFALWIVIMQRRLSLEQVVAPVVQGLGYTFEGLQCLPHGRSKLLRVFIDKSASEGTSNRASIDDCEKVSQQLKSVLTVAGETYAIEVSTPGLDRLLFTIEQCQAQVGKLLSLAFEASAIQPRYIKGRLQAVMLPDQLHILVDGQEITISVADVAEMRVVPEWD